MSKTPLRHLEGKCHYGNIRVTLALSAAPGDYMSMPYTEGAAESGVWAAALIASAAATGSPQRHAG